MKAVKDKDVKPLGNEVTDSEREFSGISPKKDSSNLDTKESLRYIGISERFKETIKTSAANQKESVSNTIKRLLYTWKILFGALFKWVILSIPIGVLIGTVASVFLMAIERVSHINAQNNWLVWLLPLGGLLIVFLYRSMGQAYNRGTNLVITVMRAQEEKIPWQITPLIIFSTLITILLGGSTGREGAALQIGASISDTISRRVKLNESDKKIIILAGMSAAFSALFGTPMAATIFPMEVISIGIIYYASLVPCVLSAFIAHFVSAKLQLHSLGAPFPVIDVPNFYSLNSGKVVILAIICALAGTAFCSVMRHGEKLALKIENQYKRAFLGGSLIIVLFLLLSTDRYMGLGIDVITKSFVEPQSIYDFLGKIAFTAVTLCAGFKGGELVPSLYIGAVLGSSLSVLFGLPPNLCAACGMSALFCAVTNSPITSLLLSFELFGFDGMAYYCVVVAISYLMSGYHGLYKEQKIIYSKTENKFVDRQAL